MFDVSFSELMLIGVIALIVIGPERLPKVARTIGHLFGRAQRYVNEVKSDIQKEMDLDEIGDIKNQMEEAARSVQSSMKQSADDIKSAVEEPAKALKDSLNAARDAVDPLPDDTGHPDPADASADPGDAPETPAIGEHANPSPNDAPAKDPHAAQRTDDAGEGDHPADRAATGTHPTAGQTEPVAPPEQPATRAADAAPAPSEHPAPSRGQDQDPVDDPALAPGDAEPAADIKKPAATGHGGHEAAPTSPEDPVPDSSATPAQPTETSH